VVASFSPDGKRLLLADEFPLMLEGLCRLLATEFDVVGTCCDGRALLEKATDLQPDAILLDIAMAKHIQRMSGSGRKGFPQSPQRPTRLRCRVAISPDERDSYA
jgi:DNA-binding NarL/FixJ family response regulator